MWGTWWIRPTCWWPRWKRPASDYRLQATPLELVVRPEDTTAPWVDGAGRRAVAGDSQKSRLLLSPRRAPARHRTGPDGPDGATDDQHRRRARHVRGRIR